MLQHITPRIEGEVVEVAKNQPEFRPVEVIIARNIDYTLPPNKNYNTVIMAVTLTGEERQRIINGEDIYISLLTHGQPQQGIMVSVGPEEMAAAHGLEVKKPVRDYYTPLESGEITNLVPTNERRVAKAPELIAPYGGKEGRMTFPTSWPSDDELIVKEARKRANSWTLNLGHAIAVLHEAQRTTRTSVDIYEELKRRLQYCPSHREVVAIVQAARKS